MKVLIFLVNFYCFTNCIQVFENDQNDTTTAISLTHSQMPMTVSTTTIATSSESPSNETLKSSIESKEIRLKSLKQSPKPFEVSKSSDGKHNGSHDNYKKPNQIDQQQKSSAQKLHHKKFIPSPELASIVQPNHIQQTPQETFYPSNRFYKPVPVARPQHTTPSPIENDSSKWQISSKELPNLRQNYPKFEEQIRHGYNDLPKTTWNPTENGYWIWMPHEKPTEQPEEKSTQTNIEHWKWNFDEIEKEKPTFSTEKPQTPLSYDTPSFYHYLPLHTKVPTTKDYPYSFDVTSTLSTPHIYETSSFVEEKHKKENNFQHNLDLFKPTTQHIPEWSQLLAHGNKGNEETSTNHVSPWKKIIHVLSAAIPIGLLISALTPQVVYVNPNSTNSLVKPSLNLLSKQHRSLNDNSDENEHFSTRKLTNPLMDFLNILNDQSTKSSDKIYNSCDDRHFCEITLNGIHPNANVLQKMLWKIAYETPHEQAIKSGLYEIFQAVKTNNCSIFVCDQSSATLINSTNQRKQFRTIQ